VGKNLVIIQSEANLALARKIGLHFADTELVLMIDSDVLLFHREFIELGMLILNKVKKIGAIASPLCSNKIVTKNNVDISISHE